MSDGNPIGAVRARREVEGLRLFETEYAADFAIETHPHAVPLISVVLQGSLTERWGRTRADCERSALTYLPSHVPHSQEHHANGSRCFLVQFGQSWVDRMTDLGLESCVDPLALKGSRANWLADQLYREFKTPDEASGLAVEGLALAMLGELVRADSARQQEAHPGWLVRAVEMLHSRVRGDVVMAEIAREVDVHPTHLARTFRERFGCTMGEYLRRLRIDAAREEMLSTDRPLSSIAFSAGFADQAHFTRIFKQETGATPGAWRKARSSR